MDLVINATLEEMPATAIALPQYGSYWLNVLACINEEKGSFPLGELFKQLNGFSGRWVVMSPIHWEATHNDAFIIATGEDLPFTDEESRALFTAISEFLAEETLYYHDAHHWLMKVDGKPALNSHPPSQLLHHSLMPELKRMDKTLYWQRLFTEIQMYLAGHAQYPQLMINGFWFYGDGELTLAAKKSIFTDDPQLLNLFAHQMQPLTKDLQISEQTVWISQQFLPLESCLQKHNTHWLWNNKAYTMPAKSWWKRLLSI